MFRLKSITAAALLAFIAAAAYSAVGRQGSSAASACAPPTPAPTSPRKIDEYGNLRWSDEQARLDNFAVELREAEEATGYIIAYDGRRARAGEARRRMERAKRFLTTVRKIAPQRIVLIDGGHREDLTVELWAIPSDANPPEATPTVDPAEVEIIRPKPKRQRARRAATNAKRSAT